MGLGEWYSLLRRGIIGRFADTYFAAFILDKGGICPGLTKAIERHLLVYLLGVFVVSLLCDTVQLVTKPDLPPCRSVEPELNFKEKGK